MKKTTTSNQKQPTVACWVCVGRIESSESVQRPTVSITLESLEKALV